MSVQIRPIVRTRGDTYPFTVTFVDDSGTPLDLTGASFVLTVSEKEDPLASDVPLFDLVGTVSAPTTGVVEFSMTESDADHVGLFYYDIQMTAAQGYIRTMMRGTFKMRQDITKNGERVWVPNDGTFEDGTRVDPGADDGIAMVYVDMDLGWDVSNSGRSEGNRVLPCGWGR
jgi:hypothetical protein